MAKIKFKMHADCLSAASSALRGEQSATSLKMLDKNLYFYFWAKLDKRWTVLPLGADSPLAKLDRNWACLWWALSVNGIRFVDQSWISSREVCISGAQRFSTADSPPLGRGQSTRSVTVIFDTHVLHSDPLVLNGGQSGFCEVDSPRKLCFHVFWV
jgi:hypothetical protein